MSRVVIPGGSGFLGQALAARLVGRGDEVVILSRDGGQQVEGTRIVVWDAESIGPWASELDGADAIVHLTGRRADVRGTKRNIDELITSRVQPVRVVGEAIGRCATPPRVCGCSRRRLLSSAMEATRCSTSTRRRLASARGRW